MKKAMIFFLLMMVLPLLAIESEPSEIVGYVNYNLAAGDYNMVAIPMEINFPVAGESPMASDLANFIGSQVEQILFWNTETSAFKFYTGNEATDFPITSRSALMVKISGDADVQFYSYGKYIDSGTINLEADYNMFMLPLNRSDITMTSELCDNIGTGTEVEQVLFWNTETSAFKFYTGNEVTDFPIEIGDALMLKSSSAVSWNSSNKSITNDNENNWNSINKTIK